MAAAVAVSAPAVSAAAAETAEMRGLWVECQGSNDTLVSKEKISGMFNRAASSNINAVFLQVHRGNKAWFRSSFADSGPCESFRKKYGIDPLTFSIEEAHARGIEIHAWVNVYRILKNMRAPILKRIGRGAITCDGKGKSLLSYPPKKLPDGGYWLDPGDGRVNEYLLKLVGELAGRYPKLDGIHLDFVRYPSPGSSGAGSLFSGGNDFGYGTRAVAAFKAKSGLNPLKMKKNRENCELWDGWRRDRVTDFVRAAGRRLRKINPKMQLSAAVFASAGRAYSEYFQDWRRWMEDGLLDFVAPMNYTIDSRMMKYRTKVAVSSAGGRRACIGLGAYLLTNKPSALLAQIRDVRSLGAGGVILFSYDAMLKRQSIFSLLKQRVFSRSCPPPPSTRKK
ncbi:MAG: family 10 glycosylhydrolase [Candidatus Tritonobacter lacicola]|nr:family 10 glycosylhydrolase [Candidatus Tritonobacter lacicola]